MPDLRPLRVLLASLLRALLGLGALALLAPPAQAAHEEDVELSLAGGEVVGPERGEGKASVEAKVRNHGKRNLTGVRIAVYYSSRDALPGSNAQWLIHEFVFEPPLKPGGVSTLRFSDENAGEYVALMVRRAVFEPGLAFNGSEVELQSPLLSRQGVAFIALRDLAAILEAKLTLEKGGMIVFARDGMQLKLKPGQDFALRDGKKVALDQKLIEQQGRSYIALSQAATLLGLKLESDDDSGLLNLTDATTDPEQPE